MRSWCHFPLSSGFDCRPLEKSEIEHGNPYPRRTEQVLATSSLPPPLFQERTFVKSWSLKRGSGTHYRNGVGRNFPWNFSSFQSHQLNYFDVCAQDFYSSSNSKNLLLSVKFSETFSIFWGEVG